MRASDCLTASMIEVGMKYEKKIAFSHEDVETYCRLADDQNSIHRCLEAARVRFPDIDDIVVPGGLLQIAIAGLFGSYFPGDGSLGLTFEPDRVRKPIRPGDELLISLEVMRMRREMAEFKITITDATGDQISGAKSRVMLPDKAYRSWWEQEQ